MDAYVTGDGRDFAIWSKYDLLEKFLFFSVFYRGSLRGYFQNLLFIGSQQKHKGVKFFPCDYANFS